MTAGEGGMIVTDDDAIAEEARAYRDQGKARLGLLVNEIARLADEGPTAEELARRDLLSVLRVSGLARSAATVRCENAAVQAHSLL